ncbi:hypothetical protein TI03_04915 [Achromatium sp. WMS1]|nr:hypothetical protein TI03_04915 [Achromatium sp. WMS1]
MNLVDIINIHVQALPPTLQRETLDFIAWLETRYAIPAPTDVPPMSDTEAFIAKHVGGLSPDFPNDIDDSDLGEDCPRDILK